MLIPVHGCRCLEPIPAAQVTWDSTLMGSPSIARCITHTHTRSDWDNLDTPINPARTSLGCGRSLCRHGEPVQTPLTQWSWLGTNCFSSSMLFKDPL